jgi:hypothetical protein
LAEHGLIPRVHRGAEDQPDGGRPAPHAGLLQHLTDETRHALAFKRLACVVAGYEVTGYLCLEAAVTYFQTLDRVLAAWATQAIGRRGQDDGARRARRERVLPRCKARGCGRYASRFGY